MANLICLLFGMAITLYLLAIAIRRGLRPMAAATAYRQVAWQLGLDADTRGLLVQGFIEERSLFLGELPPSPGARSKYPVRAQLGLAFPLGCQLTLRSVPRRKLPGRRDASGPNTGDPDFDERFAVKADEAALRLLTPEVRSAFLQLAELHPEVAYEADRIQVLLRLPLSRAQRMLDLIEALRHTASCLESARRTAPLPEPLAPFAAPWADWAAELGLVYDPQLPAMLGLLNGRSVRVYLTTEDDHLPLLRVRCVQSPPLGLRLLPQDPSESPLAFSQDLLVGDSAFDAAFIIQGYAPERVRELLSAPTREGLLRLRTSGTIQWDDQALQLTLFPSARDHLPQALRALAEMVPEELS